MGSENTSPTGNLPMNEEKSGRHKLLLIMVITLSAALIAALALIVFMVLKPDGKLDNTHGSSNVSDTVAERAQEDKYLEIVELGLKIKLTETVDDLVYTIKTSSEGNQSASITRKSLIDKGECKSEGDSDSLGAVTYFKDPNARDYLTEYTNQQVFPGAVEINGLHYIIIPSMQDTCYDPRTASEDVRRLSSEGIDFLRNATIELR